MDPAQPIERIAVVVLRSNRQGRRVGLQPRLYKKERRAESGSDHTGCRASEQIRSEGLHVCIMEEKVCDALAHGLVESEAAAIEDDLVDVLHILLSVYDPNQEKGFVFFVLLQRFPDRETILLCLRFDRLLLYRERRLYRASVRLSSLVVRPGAGV